ncbi:4Fe-4S double cluster binding domain-containing protein [Chloroflexota bacterium]
MTDVLAQVSRVMSQCNFRSRTVSITHLPEVQEAVGNLIRQGLINEQLYKNWHFYLGTNKNLPEAATIIIVAMPQPITRLKFEWQGNTYPAEIAPNYIFEEDESRAEENLNAVLSQYGYKIVRAHLALKTLAVRSGLAEYGRNNISYISEFGSFYRLIAFYTDYPCEEDNWRDVKVMKICENCSLCIENCPTGSISSDRFLIHAEKCLGSLNEKEPNVSYWSLLQPDWINAFIGCMSCQSICPANKSFMSNILDGDSFSEEETNAILDRIPLVELSEETRRKLEKCGIGKYPLLASNLSVLIEKQTIARQR